MPQSDASPLPVVTPCSAEVRLSDGEVFQAVFWLLPDRGRASGVTSLDRLLDGTREFLAVGLPEGGSALVRRDSIVTATLSAEEPGAPDEAEPGASLDVVTLHLESGDAVSGILQAVSPRGSGRMSDLFNGPERFLAVALADRVVLVSKARIARVSF